MATVFFSSAARTSITLHYNAVSKVCVTKKTFNSFIPGWDRQVGPDGCDGWRIRRNDCSCRRNQRAGSNWWTRRCRWVSISILFTLCKIKIPKIILYNINFQRGESVSFLQQLQWSRQRRSVSQSTTQYLPVWSLLSMWTRWEHLFGWIHLPSNWWVVYSCVTGRHDSNGFAHIQDRSLPAAPSFCFVEQGKGSESALQWILLILLLRFIQGLMLPCPLLQR